MANRVWGVALAVAVICGCGGSDPAPPPTSTTPDQPTSQPPTTSNPPPTTDTPPPPANPPPPTDGSPPPATDTPPPAGTVPAACAGLLPDAPGAGVAHALPPPPSGSACDDAVTDGRGAWIGVGYVTLDAHHWRFVDAATPGAPSGGLDVTTERTYERVLAPQPDGYHALSALPGSFRRHDAKGALLSDDRTTDAWTIERLPGGGSVVARVEGTGAATTLRLVWMDAAGTRRGDALLPPSGGTPRLAVSSTGHVLVLGAGQARWFGADGAPLTDWFAYSESGGGSRALQGISSMPLADGSVIDAINTPGPLRFEDASTKTGAPPAWVVARKAATSAVVRGGRANAFASIVSRPGEACQVTVEVLTPAGETCGAVKLTAPEPCDDVTFGADGSLLTRGWPKGDGCKWHWWSGLLR